MVSYAVTKYFTSHMILLHPLASYDCRCSMSPRCGRCDAQAPSDCMAVRRCLDVRDVHRWRSQQHQGLARLGVAYLVSTRIALVFQIYQLSRSIFRVLRTVDRLRLFAWEHLQRSLRYVLIHPRVHGLRISFNRCSPLLAHIAVTGEDGKRVSKGHR